MRYRPLGNTGLELSEISIGTEWLYKKAKKDVTDVMQKAIEYGVNYFDIIFNMPNYLDSIFEAIKNHREKLILTHHLGSSFKDEKYKKTRNIKEILANFENFLKTLNTDYVDIGFIHFVMNKPQYEECCKEGGVFDLAMDLKKEGKVKHIGISTHDVKVAMEAAQTGKIDVIMIQVNMANNALEGRNELLQYCAQQGVGIVAMKPFGGGTLLLANKTVSLGGYKTAGKPITKKKLSKDITSAKCLHYLLSQVGISAALPGVASMEELDDCMNYYNLSDEELDYSLVLKEFDEYIKNQCVYCNHCQPCQVDIDIGPMFRLLDLAKIDKNEELVEKYKNLDVKASACIECGDCLERCPFDVPIIDKMKELVVLFE